MDRAIVPIKKGDPLGLGTLAIRAQRPPAPVYDEEIEKSHYALSILGAADKKERDEEILGGFMSIETVRKHFKSNLSKESSTPDPEFMIYIDTRINYQIFIVNDTIYTRDELYDNYAFAEACAEPEDFFDRQVIGVFNNEYIAKNENDESMEFIKIKDYFELDKATKEGREFTPDRPQRIVNTKIYIAKETFDEFIQLQKLLRAMVKVKRSQEKNPEYSAGMFAIKFN
jgi:hypothetical protein